MSDYEAYLIFYPEDVTSADYEEHHILIVMVYRYIALITILSSPVDIPMMNEMIKVANLSKSFGEIRAVDDISFTVGRGQLFAFLGPNGAGKSTTINMICTLLKPDMGEITVDGFIVGMDDSEIRNRLGIVFQTGTLDPLLTVRENLSTRGALYGLRGKELEERMVWASKATGIDEILDRHYGRLSGGQRRRSDIARALINKPRILMLDEPTTGLDPQTRNNVWDTILRLREDDGITVFLTTHYMEEAEGADHVIIINEGRIAAEGTPSELKENYTSDFLFMSSREIENLKNALDADGIAYEQNGSDRIVIKLGNTKDSIDIISRHRDLIDSLEVRMGTMDDTFINVTGGTIV